MAHLSERGLDSPESGLEVFGRTDAHVSDSEDSTFQMILAARHGRPMLLAEYLPEHGVVDSGGILDCRDGVRRETRIREQLEAEAVYGRPRSVREPGRSRDSVLDTFFLEHPKSLAKCEDSRPSAIPPTVSVRPAAFSSHPPLPPETPPPPRPPPLS